MKNNRNNYKIYVHINKTNGKLYIGQTCNVVEKRWANGRGYKGCRHFENAINKYGWNNFEHIVLIENLSLEEANIIEEELIKKYKTLDCKYGYNISSGGLNRVCSEETKELLRNNKDAIKAITDFAIRARGKSVINLLTNVKYITISEAHRCTNDSMSKISKQCNDNDICKEWMFLSDYEKLSESEKLEIKNRSPYYNRKKYKRNSTDKSSNFYSDKKPTGYYEKYYPNGYPKHKVLHIKSGITYNTLREASEDTGIGKSKIKNHCNNMVKTPQWKYVYI